MFYSTNKYAYKTNFTSFYRKGFFLTLVFVNSSL